MVWESKGKKNCEHTLKEFLARILFEECFMSDRANKVVNHEFKDRLDLRLGIAGIMSKGSVLPSLTSTYSHFIFEMVSLTHSPLSSIRRARYIEAAAIWLG